jgi:hypothetical protein
MRPRGGLVFFEVSHQADLKHVPSSISVAPAGRAISACAESAQDPREVIAEVRGPEALFFLNLGRR